MPNGVGVGLGIDTVKNFTGRWGEERYLRTPRVPPGVSDAVVPYPRAWGRQCFNSRVDDRLLLLNQRPPTPGATCDDYMAPTWLRLLYVAAGGRLA